MPVIIKELGPRIERDIRGKEYSFRYLLVLCDICKEEVERRTVVVNRAIKYNKNIYCLKCRNQHRKEYQKTKHRKRIKGYVNLWNTEHTLYSWNWEESTQADNEEYLAQFGVSSEDFDIKEVL